MIGTLDPRQREVTVIGGGIAGMLFAFYAQKRGYQATLIEKSDRLGGMIQTDSLATGIAEQAAHSLLAPPSVMEFMREIGVNFTGVHPEATARYILREGRLRKFPLGVLEMGGLLIRALSHTAPMTDSVGGPTLAEWTRRHLGEKALRYLVGPMVTGIYACTPDELAQAAAFPRLSVAPGRSLARAQLTKPRSSRPARGPMVTPRGGMGEIIKKLQAALEASGVKIQLAHSALSAIPLHNVAICTSAPAATIPLLRFPDSGAIVAALKRVQYAPLISLTLIVRKDRAHPRGVGVLIPRGEGYRILGVLFNSSAFPDRVIDDAHASYTVMIGGTGDPRALQESDETLVQIATQETSRLFGTAIEVLEARLFRWPAAIPIYNHALLETWDAARGWAAQPGRVLFGNYTGQVSVRGMIESAAALPGRE